MCHTSAKIVFFRNQSNSRRFNITQPDHRTSSHARNRYMARFLVLMPTITKKFTIVKKLTLTIFCALLLTASALAQSGTAAPKNACKRDTVLISQSREGNTLISRYAVRCANCQTATVSVHFALDVSSLSPSFGDNGAAMATLNKWLHSTDTTMHITTIAIHGYASPDGEQAKNASLARSRAEAMATYIQKQYPTASVNLASTAYAWSDCQSAVQQSGIADKGPVLNIIGSNEPPMQKEHQLQGLPAAWSTLTHSILPTMRRVDVTFTYCTTDYFTRNTAITPPPTPKPVETTQPAQPTQSPTQPQPIAVIEEQETGIIIEMPRGEKEHPHHKKQGRKARK